MEGIEEYLSPSYHQKSMKIIIASLPVEKGTRSSKKTIVSPQICTKNGKSNTLKKGMRTKVLAIEACCSYLLPVQIDVKNPFTHF